MPELLLPRVELVASYLDFLDETAAHDGIAHASRPEVGETPARFVERLRAWEIDEGIEARVPRTTYWATIDDRVVGHIGLRHRLDAELAEYGGHIGYTVRPSCRGRGFAKQMLEQVLATPTAIAIGKLLLTCAPNNAASIRIIEACGGVLDRTTFVDRIGRDTSRYWIAARRSRSSPT